MTTWDERFRTGQYPQDPDPSLVLRQHLGAAPEGRALDVATGTGRNAVFLATAGYDVDAVDKSRPGLEQARANARRRGVADRFQAIQADVPGYEFPEAAYDVVTVSFYRAVDRLPDIKEALVEGGLLYVQHHLRTTDDVDRGPSGDRYRFAANELLQSCLDMTVLYFDQKAELREGRRAATTELVARNSTGRAQSWPIVDPVQSGSERSRGRPGG
jgi:Methylase involved in ubiquinone/menaquinone biosynthesis